MHSVWENTQVRNENTPIDVVEALHVRHFTLDKEDPERALNHHLDMMYNASVSYDYNTGAKDDTQAKQVVEREKELWQKGQEYFAQGYRLHFGPRHMIGIPCDVPKEALAWVVVSAGHIAMTEAHRLAYVIKI